MKVECPHLSQFPSIKHAFFEANAETRKSAKVSLTGQVLPLVTLKQIHGDKVYTITNPLEIGKEGDGLATMQKGIALGIQTADCGPVLFYDPHAQVIGACHAGWRGAKAGILQATLQAMEDLGANRSQIYATLGPTIQHQDYEVGPEFPDLINETYEAYFSPSQKKGHHYFNLPRYICDQLLSENLAYVHDVQCNTLSGNFYSRRRLLSEGKEKMAFSNLSVIAIL